MGLEVSCVPFKLRRSPGAQAWMRFHAFMAPVWFVLIIPTVIWWRESVLWVALISCYANAVGHFSAWQAARAEVQGDNSS